MSEQQTNGLPPVPQQAPLTMGEQGDGQAPAPEPAEQPQAPVPEPAVEPAAQPQTPAQGTTPIERFYDRFEGISLKKLDLFIGICTALLIGVLVLGFVQARM